MATDTMPCALWVMVDASSVRFPLPCQLPYFRSSFHAVRAQSKCFRGK